MIPKRARSKKEPRYLEDITYSVAEAVKKEDLFVSNKFLGLYDEAQIMSMLRKSGMVRILYDRGYRDLVISLLKDDNYTSRLYVNYQSDADEETRLIEIVVREGVFRPKETFVKGFDFQDGLSMLMIEWLTLQDPRASFSSDKPRLPGQGYPGLGGLKNIQGMLYTFGKASGKDAIIDVPEFYHAAVIYSRLYSEIYSQTYSLFSPRDAGQLQAMIRDFKDASLADVSFAIAFDCLLDARTGEKAQWKPSEQIYPLARRLHQYFGKKGYKEVAEKTTNELSFTMDWEKYEHVKEQGMTDEV